MGYRQFQKRHPEWPEALRDAVGRRVRLKHTLMNTYGQAFAKGDVMTIGSKMGGKLSLWNGLEFPDSKHINGVHPVEVELLRPESIVWRNKEAFLLFCIAVAGKNSRQTQGRVEAFLEPVVGAPGERDTSPFLYVRNLVEARRLLPELKRLGFGQYTKLVRAFTEAATSDVDLDRCRPADLEAIHGVGPKTSRYFIMRTRPRARVAALDTHILRWLRDAGHEGIPQSTPQSGPAYARVEKIFLAEARRRRVRPAQLDADIWDTYSRHGMSAGERAQVDEVAAFA